MMNSSWQQLVFEFYGEQQTDIREANGSIDPLAEHMLREVSKSLQRLREPVAEVRHCDVRLGVMCDLLRNVDMLLCSLASRDLVRTSEQTASLLYQVVATAVIFKLPLDSLFNEIHAARHGGFSPDIRRVLTTAGLIITQHDS